MIDDLPPDVRALVSASRSRLGPDAATVARLHTKVHAAVIAGGVAASGTAGAASTGAATTAGGAASAGGAAAGLAGVVAKLAVAVALVTAVGTVAYVRHTPSQPAVAPTIEVATSSHDDRETDVAPRIVTIEREPAPPPESEPAVIAPLAAPAHVAAEPAPTPPTLAREIALVDQASKALHRGDQAGVLAAIKTFDLETGGHGQLAEDADAISLEAACVSNSPDAATKLAAFTQRWPKSAQLTRLTSVCHKGSSQ